MAVKRMTCLSYLRDGQRVPKQDEEDDVEQLCEDSDNEGQEYDPPVHRFLTSSYAAGTLYTFLLILVAGSFIALVAVITHVLLPYTLVRDFHASTCVPWELVVEEGRTCMCGVGCTAQYRCLLIKVVYLDRHGRWRNATVYDDEAALGKECSFYPPCHTSLGLISDAVHEYETEYGTVGRSFSCLYGDRLLGHVIRTRKYHISDVVHGILWSVVGFLCSTAALILTIKKCRWS